MKPTICQSSSKLSSTWKELQSLWNCKPFCKSLSKVEDSNAFDDNSGAVISDRDNIREVEPVNMHIRFGNTEKKSLVDSKSICTIINKSLADSVVLNCQESYRVQSPENHDLKTFSNIPINTIGVVIRESVDH